MCFNTPLTSTLHEEKETGMTMKAHVTALAEKHAQLEQIIAQELARPLPDHIRLAELKKQKLRLKEEMEALRHSTSH